MVSCNAAKFVHVVGGIVTVDGHKRVKEGGYRLLGVHSADDVADKNFNEPFAFL